MQDIFTTLDKTANNIQGSAKAEGRVFGDFALKNKDEVQKWQNRFCEMAQVYGICLDANGVPITEFSGNTHEIEIIRKYVTPVRIHNIYRRVSESEMEDQAVEVTEIPNLRLAAQAFRHDG